MYNEQNEIHKYNKTNTQNNRFIYIKYKYNKIIIIIEYNKNNNKNKMII